MNHAPSGAITAPLRPMNEPIWKTAITDDRADGGGRIRGYALTELIGGRSMAEVTWLLLRGELPTANQAKMLDALIVASSDHGVAVPSAVAARTAASGGATMSASVAAGLLAIGPHHGGAIELAMRQLSSGSGKDTVESTLKEGKRMAGFGHRVYTDEDPRATRLLQLATDLGIAGDACGRAKEVEDALLDAKAKKFPLNIDGALAAILLDLGFPPELGNGIFVIGRTLGLVAHVAEEAAREKPFRRTPEDQVTYDGLAPRSLP